jgi:hypothetical protein
VTVNINGLSCIHQTSGGVATATLPDVCRTPYAGTPVPYPNVALSADLVGGTATIAVDGSPAAIQSSMFVKSTGDEAGALGGVVSQVFMMEATFLSFSPTVLFEGQPVCRLTDKMLMNKGNTVCMSGAENPPVVAPDSAPMSSIREVDPTEPVFCQIDSFQIGCSHQTRPTIDLVRDATSVLQVISTKDEPDSVVVSLIGHCGAGSPSCPSLLVMKKPHGHWVPVEVPEGTIELPPPDKLGLANLSALVEWLVGDGKFPRDAYLLRPLICNRHDHADVAVGIWTEIEVFHEAKIEGTVELSYAHPKIPKPDTKKADNKLIYDRLATWSLSGKLEGVLGGWTLPPLEKSADMEGSDPLPIFGTLVDAIGQTTYVFDSMKQFGANVKGDILFPKWKIGGGSLELAELSSSTRVGAKGTFSVGFDPLIGFQLTVSLLDYLILFAGGLAGPPGIALSKALLYVKNNFGAGAETASVTEARKKLKGNRASLDVEIELVAKSQLDGELKVTFSEGKGNMAGRVSGRVSVQIEGRVIGKAKVWRFEMAGVGKMGIGDAEGKGKPCEFEARLVATENRGRFIPDGGVYFSGMAFYYLFYFELGMGGVESEKKGSKPGGLRTGREMIEDDDEADAAKDAEPTKAKQLAKKEFKGSCVLIQPWSWTYSQAQKAKERARALEAAPGATGSR